MRSKLRALPFVIFLLPFDLIVALGIILACLWRRKRPPIPQIPPINSRDLRNWRPFSSPKATIVIVNWDGKHLLAECLPAVLDALQYAGGHHEILVVDNG